MLHALSNSARPDPTVEHGGDLAAARRKFPDAPEPWIDLSTGINPRPYPFGSLPAACFERLPEPGALAALERVAAMTYGATGVVAAPGAQALIQILPRILPGRRVGILGPTYAEHAAAWRRAGREVVDCASPDELAACDIGVLVNPNNPDGRIVATDELGRLARRTVLVIDESFADFTPAMSMASAAPLSGAIVLRSFGKTYGLAGVRLGFAIAAPAAEQRLREELGPWAVSGIAVEIGRRALADAAWRDAARENLAADAARLDALLTQAGLRVVGGTSLFRLAENPEAQAIGDALGRAGFHVRRFAARPNLLRFGLPPTSAWLRLERALCAGDGFAA